jgi:capsular polysaccharide biosynthesis protein
MKKNYSELSFSVDLIQEEFKLNNPIHIVDKVQEELGIELSIHAVSDYLDINRQEDYEMESHKQDYFNQYY